MGCLLVLLAAISPRLVVFLFWLARPVQFDAAFGGPIIPMLGIIFLPFTTLMYVLLQTPGVGLSGSDWIWVGLALVLDLAHSACRGDRQAQHVRRLPVRLTRRRTRLHAVAQAPHSPASHEAPASIPVEHDVRGVANIRRPSRAAGPGKPSGGTG